MERLTWKKGTTGGWALTGDHELEDEMISIEAGGWWSKWRRRTNEEMEILNRNHNQLFHRQFYFILTIVISGRNYCITRAPSWNWYLYIFCWIPSYTSFSRFHNPFLGDEIMAFGKASHSNLHALILRFVVLSGYNLAWSLKAFRMCRQGRCRTEFSLTG